MGIPLTEILDDGNRSMREQAVTNNLPYETFTMRELITPQYRVGDAGLESGTEKWENWVKQHLYWTDEQGEERRERTELRPETREQLIASVVTQAYAEGSVNGAKVRAVGSGHSHSNAPAPEGTYIELDPGDPDEEVSDGLNSVLEGKWLKEDEELESLASDEDESAEFNPLTDSSLAPPLDQDHLKRVEAGINIRRLNRYILHPEGYALRNMGSFDGQTIAGAVNTSTHGTGIGLPAISDSVRSIEIATVPASVSGYPIVRMYRIEPDDGITDRKSFEANTGDHEMELIQDDDIFHSVVVGYGCMGVVYAYTLNVVDNYWLAEENELMAWSTLKEELGQDADSVKEFLNRDGTRHCQILLNTAAEQVPSDNIQDHEDHGIGEHENYLDPVCLVTRHKVADFPGLKVDESKRQVEVPSSFGAGTADNRWPPERRWKPWRDFSKAIANYYPIGDYPQRASQLHDGFFHPELKRNSFTSGYNKSVWYVALRRIRDRGNLSTGPYYQPPPPPRAPTTEIGVEVGDVVEAVDEFRYQVRDVTLQGPDVENGTVFFPIPMGIRFTAESEHFLSPEYGRETAMVELPLPLPRNGFIDLVLDEIVEPALTIVEQHLRNDRSDLQPRPHMGKHNTVTAEWLNQNYEHFDARNTTDIDTGWYQAYERFNHFGTFNNKFTDQLGLSGYGRIRQPLSGSFDEDEPPKTETEPTPTEPGTTTEPTSTDESPRPSTESTAEDGPGFSVLTGLAGAGAVAWLFRQRNDPTEGSADSSDAPTDTSEGQATDDAAESGGDSAEE